MTTRVAPLLAIALSALGCAVGPARRERVVYLDFADGREGVAKGEDDDATRNVSRFCAAEALPRWNGIASCGDRDACIATIRARVERYFARYQVRFTTVRPPDWEPYTTVVIAPPDAECSFGRRGVSVVDCGDANPANLGFVFDCDFDVDACAVLIAHEAAHTFGLVHVNAPGDVMTPGPEDPSASFEETEHETVDEACGASRQSSHRALLEVLGPRVP
jgi:hypothetical protein